MTTHPDHPAFELIEQRTLHRIDAEAFWFRHIQTGAEVVSVLSPHDDNKCFGIAFRTPVEDSTGLPHILEHSVLCGSEKYPVKEPFKELIKSSLNTFLNAFTYPDRTVYPVASQNLKDFYNLVDVYLDAVFAPRLTPEVFAQEGWRLELGPNDAAPTYQGVVYNEMKGAYASSENAAWDASQRSIFPDTTYGHDSGGDPEHIPNLTFDEFISFHQRLYTPSNSRAYFYGDDPPEARLALLDAYFSRFEKNNPKSEIPPQPHFSEPRQINTVYPAGGDDSPDEGIFVTVNWMLQPVADLETGLRLSLLAYLLVGQASSPLRRVLIESELGEEVFGAGYDVHQINATFSTGLRGVEPEDVDAVVNLIHQTLEAVANTGFDPELVEAGLNSFEFNLRENNTGSFPRGLAQYLSMLSSWIYDQHPFDAVCHEERMARLKRDLHENPAFLTELLSTFLIKNTHRATVVVRPDPEFVARKEAALATRLNAIQSSLSDDARRELANAKERLDHWQQSPDTPEALALMPRLTLADMRREVESLPSEIRKHGPVMIHMHPQPTAGIVYLDLAFDLRALPQHLLAPMAFLGGALFDIDTAQRDYAAMARWIARATGGIDGLVYLNTHEHSGELVAHQIIRGKALCERMPDMLDILRETLTDLRWDQPARFRQLVQEEKANEEANIIPSGHSFVRTRLGAHFSLSGWATETISGADYLLYIRDLAENFNAQWPSTKQAFETAFQKLFHPGNLSINLCAPSADMEGLYTQLTAWIDSLPARPPERHEWTLPARPAPEALRILAPVNYVGMAAQLNTMLPRIGGGHLVANRLLRTNWLWDRVRVQGGAYGCSSSVDRQNGVITFTSYRDPHTLRTLEAYKAGAEYLRSIAHNDAERERSIIGMIGDLSPVLLPDAKSYASFVRNLSGISDTTRQTLRNETLATERHDILAFADAIEAALSSPFIAILGNENNLREVSQVVPGNWTWKNIL